MSDVLPATASTSGVDPLRPGIHSFEVDGVRQVYEVAGHGPVCVTHSGGPGIDSGYLRLPLLEQRMTMVYLAPVGTTGSSRLRTHPLGYTHEVYASFLQRTVEHLGVSGVFVLGHSAGGWVALRHALEHPGVLAGVILYDTTAVNGPEAYCEADREMAEFARRHAVQPAVTEVVDAWRRLRTVTNDDDVRTEVLRTLLPAYFADYWAREAEFEVYRRGLRATVVVDPDGVTDYRDELGGIAVPVLVLVGLYDFICPPSWARQLAREIPCATLKTFQNSGHFAHLEQPDAFAAAVTEFVEVHIR